MIRSSLHSTVRRALPRSFISTIRSTAERYFDWPWRRKYYSQLGEDVILLSHMEHTAWLENRAMPTKGFYVDVGAYSPKLYSNTYLFYKKGWRGINIDATPGTKKLFDAARNKDTNIEAAISDEPKQLTFYSWGSPNVGNTFSEEHARTWEQRMNRPPERITIHTQRLSTVLSDHVPDGTRIDFMSIDVEGHNLSVLRSNNWVKFAPAYLIVEADVEPRTIQDVYESELYTFLTSKQYRLEAWLGISLIFKKIVNS